MNRKAQRKRIKNKGKFILNYETQFTQKNLLIPFDEYGVGNWG